MKEIHLLIIWSKAVNKKEKILNDLKSKFDVLKVLNVTWSLDKFSENLSRFYGENLPKNSGKEKHCGNETFTCIIVRDNTPIYESRETSKGFKIVNSNLFDIKQLYRNWTGGGHKIHATDDTNETKLQLALLFAEEYKEYLNKEISIEEFNYNKNLIGSNGWASFEDLFYILNLTAKYVILRNFTELEKQLNTKHPDVDLLVENKNLVIQILNATATTKKTYREQYNVIIDGKNINFDFRNIGDNYYDKVWEYDILDTREKYKYFYIPEEKIYLYTLIYHALVHKNYISPDYIKTFIELFNSQNIQYKMSDFIESNLLIILLNYMRIENYSVVEPRDLTVGFNTKLLRQKINIEESIQRRSYDTYLETKSKIKSGILKILKRLAK